MAVLVILLGVVLIVAAIRNTQGDLFSALGTDIPAFATWAAAIFALALIGYLPGMRPVSRGLMALVILVIVMRNYQTILSSFASLAGQGGGTGGSAAA